jgi:hypothetical protein
MSSYSHCLHCVRKLQRSTLFCPHCRCCLCTFDCFDLHLIAHHNSQAAFGAMTEAIPVYPASMPVVFLQVEVFSKLSHQPCPLIAARTPKSVIAAQWLVSIDRPIWVAIASPVLEF